MSESIECQESVQLVHGEPLNQWLEHVSGSIEEEMGVDLADLFRSTVVNPDKVIPGSVDEAKTKMKDYLQGKNLSQEQISTLEEMINNTVGQHISPQPDLGDFSDDELVEMRNIVFEAYMTVYDFPDSEFDAQTPYQELAMELKCRLKN